MTENGASYPPPGTHPAIPFTSHAASFRNLDILVAALLMSLVSFSLPGRAVPSAGSLDLLALAKFVIRLGVVVWFAVVWLQWTIMQWQQRRVTLSRFLISGDWTSPVLVPWWAFLCWSFCTIAVSPLKVVSAGQWLGLAALVFFAQAVAIRYQTATAIDSRRPVVHWMDALMQLYLVLGLYSTVLACIWLVVPELSGLDRSMDYNGDDGVVHPTAAGATSALGIVLGTMILLCGHSRRRFWLVLSLAIHCSVVILSTSRAALAMTCLALLVGFALLASVRARAWMMLSAGMCLLTILVVDPGLERVSTGFEGTAQFVRRDQTVHQLRNVSGRVEMWTAVWQEFRKSPLVGYGYFVTSSDGMLDVWDGPANHDAHNVGLQVLVSTGVVGGLLFAWIVVAHGWYLAMLFQRNKLPARIDQLARLLAIMSIWYIGWGQACTSFLGPIRPESVTFFVVVGLLAGSVERRVPEQREAELTCRF